MARKTYGHAYSKEQGVVITEQTAPRKSMEGLSPYSATTIKEGPLRRLAERVVRGK